MSEPAAKKIKCVAMSGTGGPGATVAPALPSPPVQQALDGASCGGPPASELNNMKLQMEAEQAVRDGCFPKSGLAATAAQHAMHAFHCGRLEDASPLLQKSAQLVVEILKEVEAGPRAWYVRDAQPIASAVEQCACAHLFKGFLETGQLISTAELAASLGNTVLTGEEYIYGVLAFCSELPRYAIGRATAGDVGSVLVCKELSSSAFYKLAEFDFRNGKLRQRFDRVKYVVRKCEDLLYELSLSGKYVAAPPTVGSAGAATTEKETQLPRVTEADFDRIHGEIEAYDRRREQIIKRSRDVQKLSKNAIYSLHRDGPEGKAAKQLDEAARLAQAIMAELVEGCPPLRSEGSYTSCMEEYAEARLFQVWLASGGRIAGPDDKAFSGLVSSTEFLGGLADFTGEVGRWAVQAASRRDIGAVQLCLATDQAAWTAWMQLELPGKLAKKEGALKQNTSKVEALLYDLSVVKSSSGGSGVVAEDNG